MHTLAWKIEVVNMLKMLYLNIEEELSSEILTVIPPNPTLSNGVLHNTMKWSWKMYPVCHNIVRVPMLQAKTYYKQHRDHT